MKTESSMRYEAAVLEMLDRQFLPRGFRVEGTRGGIQFRHPGRYSRTARQLDGAVFAFERPMPFLVADAKCRTVKLDVKDVEMFLGMMDDVGAPVGMLVAPLGYTPAATRRAAVRSVECRVVTIQEAEQLNWLAIARSVFPLDWAFHPELSLAIQAVSRADAPEVITAILDAVPFDEWEAACTHCLAAYPREGHSFLAFIAANHLDDGWRFNAIRLLAAEGLLSAQDATALLQNEPDPETRELLRSIPAR